MFAVSNASALLQASASVEADAHMEADLAAADSLALWQNSRVQAASALNPLSAFTFSSADEWSLWPGLRKEINLYSDCVVLAQYQTAADASNSHMLSRMLVDSTEVVATRSAQGNTKYASNFGIFVDHLSAGPHVFEVQYRTSAVNNKFVSGGMDWQTRALNVLALPEANVNDVNPRWQFKLSSADLWSEWQGFRQEQILDLPTPTIGIYTAVVDGKNMFLASKIFLDSQEIKESRAVAGDTTFAQNTGFFAGILAPGKHSWTVKYRTKSRNNLFKDNEWMARSLNIVTLPGADMWSVYDDSEFTTSDDGTFRPWKGLEKKVTLTADRYVLVMYSVAVQSHTDDVASSSVKSTLRVNGLEQKQARSRCGVSRYCQLNGMWMGVLSVGTHDFKAMYSTTSVLKMQEGLEDYQNRALFIVALSTVSSAISSGQPAGTGDGNDATATGNNAESSASSFIDLAGHLQGLTDMEKQVRAGTAPEHVMKKLRAAGVLGDDAEIL